MKRRLPGFAGEVSLYVTGRCYWRGAALMAHSGAVVPALTISQDLAHMICKGTWVQNMEKGTSVCSWCEKTPAGTDKCHYIACDRSGCDYVTVRRGPKRTPTLPGSAFEPLRY